MTVSPLSEVKSPVASAKWPLNRILADTRPPSPAGSSDSRVLLRARSVFGAMMDEVKETRRAGGAGQDEDALQPSQENRQHLREALKSSNRLFIAPDSTFKWNWDVLLFVVTAYHAVSVPLVWIDFFGQAQLVINCIITIILVADIAINFHLGFMDNFRLVDDRSKIRANYLFGKSLGSLPVGWFFIDLLHALPIDLICYALAPFSLFKLLYHLRLLRLFKIKTLFIVSGPPVMNSSYVSLHFNYVPRMMLFFYVLVFLNVVTVIWINIQSSYDVMDFKLYTIGLYYIMYTCGTIGFGDIPVLNTRERWFAIMLFCVGITWQGFIVAKFSSYVARADKKGEGQARMVECLEVLRFYNIPNAIKHEVLAFMHYQIQNSTNTNEILDALPKAMRSKLGLYIKVKFVSMVPMFAAATADCKLALAMALKNQLAIPEEDVIKVGDVGDAMFFLGHGIVKVILPGKRIFLKKGAFFGEMAMLSDQPRGATIRALTYCDLFRLDKGDFRAILERFPDFRTSVETEAQKRAQRPAQAPPPPSQARRDGRYYWKLLRSYGSTRIVYLAKPPPPEAPDVDTTEWEFPPADCASLSSDSFYSLPADILSNAAPIEASDKGSSAKYLPQVQRQRPSLNLDDDDCPRTNVILEEPPIVLGGRARGRGDARQRPLSAGRDLSPKSNQRNEDHEYLSHGSLLDDERSFKIENSQRVQMLEHQLRLVVNSASELLSTLRSQQRQGGSSEFTTNAGFNPTKM